MDAPIRVGISRLDRAAINPDGVGHQSRVDFIIIVGQIESQVRGGFLHHTRSVLREGQLDTVTGVVLERNGVGGRLPRFVGIVNDPSVLVPTGVEIAGVFLREQRVELIRFGREARPTRAVRRTIHLHLK